MKAVELDRKAIKQMSREDLIAEITRRINDSRRIDRLSGRTDKVLRTQLLQLSGAR